LPFPIKVKKFKLDKNSLLKSREEVVARSSIEAPTLALAALCLFALCRLLDFFAGKPYPDFPFFWLLMCILLT
jgi:hypothetical protein